MRNNLSPDQFPEQYKEYTKHYNAGWRHSETASSPDLDKSAPYARKHGQNDEHRRWVMDAWEDGYMDSSTGRDKYSLRAHRSGTDTVEGY